MDHSRHFFVHQPIMRFNFQFSKVLYGTSVSDYYYPLRSKLDVSPCNTCSQAHCADEYHSRSAANNRVNAFELQILS